MDDPTDLLPGLLTDTWRMARVVDAEPCVPVEHCPGWSVADLVFHLGTVQRWAADIVRTGQRGSMDPARPSDDELAGWLEAGAEALVEGLRATPLDRPTWTFDRPPGQAGFWARRQALEVGIHRWDAERAVGATTPAEPALVRAGLDELADTMVPRQVELGRTPGLPGPVRLCAADLDRTWTLPGGSEPAVEVAGEAEILWLWGWGRVPLLDGRLTYTGSRERFDELVVSLLAP